MPDRPLVAWFRQDLRLDDHPALSRAVASGRPVVPLVVLDPVLERSSTMGPRRWRRFESAVRALDRDLRAIGGRLVVRHGDARHVIERIVAETGASTVVATRSTTPFGSRRDAEVASLLAGSGAILELHDGHHVVEPGRLGSRHVFGPYFRRWHAEPLGTLLAAPDRISVPDGVAGEVLDPGTASGGPEALARLRSFLSDGLAAYPADRDRLDLDGTSRLSADLHLGTISARRVVAETQLAAALDPSLDAAATAFIRQVAWRDWAHERLQTTTGGAAPGTSRPDREADWRDDGAGFEAWSTGQTGYPTVDAAMRQLASTGWLGNRARMVAASFLTKHLLIDWRSGEAFFLRELEDGDVANNRFGWRWTAGVGIDAAPYFRIISPVRQGQRFDPAGAWVRRWIPALRGVPDAIVHAPWSMRGGTPAGYPEPIVDDAAARARALAAWRSER